MRLDQLIKGLKILLCRGRVSFVWDGELLKKEERFGNAQLGKAGLRGAKPKWAWRGLVVWKRQENDQQQTFLSQSNILLRGFLWSGSQGDLRSQKPFTSPSNPTISWITIMNSGRTGGFLRKDDETSFAVGDIHLLFSFCARCYFP